MWRALALALLTGCGGGGSSPSNPTVIAFYGDSITSGTYGAGSKLSPTPLEMIEAMSGQECLDYSQAGQRAQDARIQANGATVVVLRHGMADAALGTEPEVFEISIRRLIAGSAGRRVVLTGLPHLAPGVFGAPQEPVDRATVLDTLLRRIAGEQGLQFIDVRALPFKPADLIDGLHPGPDYAQRIAALVATELRGN